MKKVVIAVLVLAIGCSICIWYLVSNLGEIAQYFRPQLERYVSELSGADIHFNRIDAHLFPQPTIQIQDIRVLQGPVHLSVDSLDLGLKVAPLIRRSLVISSLRVSKPIVRLSHETPTLTKTAEKGLPQAQAARSPASKDLTFALESFEVLDGVLQVENPLTESVLELKPIMIKGAVVSEPEGNEFLFSNLTVSLNQPVVQGEVRYVPNEQIVSCSFELQPIPLQYIAEIVRLASGDSLGEVTVARGQVLGSVGAKIITGVVHTAEADLEVRDVAGSWRTTRVEGGTSRVTIRLDGSNLDYEGSAKRVSLGNPGVNIDLSVEGSGPLSQIKSKALLTSAQWNVAELSSLFPSVRLYQKSYGLTGEGDVQLSGLFQGLDLDSFRFESRVKRAGMQFLNYPFRNIEGKVIATGGPSLESIQVNDGTVELGTKGEKVSFSGNFARSTSRLKGSIAGQGLTLENLSPLVPPSTIQNSLRGVSGALRDVEIDLEYSAASPLSLNGHLKLSQISIPLEGYSISKLQGPIRFRSSNFTSGMTVESSELSFDVRDQRVQCSLNVTTSASSSSFVCSDGKGYGGSFSAKGILTKSNLQLTASGESFDAERILSLGPESVRRKVSGSVTEFEFKGSADVSSFDKTANGTGEFKLVDGSLRGVNIGKLVLERLQALPLFGGTLIQRIPSRFHKYFEGNDTPIRQLVGRFKIERGVVNAQRLLLESDQYTVLGSGKVGLGSAMDLSAEFEFHEELSRALAESIHELRRVLNRQGRLVFPLAITGVLPNLTVIPDLRRLIELGTQRFIEDKAQEFIGDLIGQRRTKERNGDQKSPAESILDQLLRKK